MIFSQLFRELEYEVRKNLCLSHTEDDAERAVLVAGA